MRRHPTEMGEVGEMLAEAIRASLISPNVPDSNLEPANLVDTTNRIARALFDVAGAIRELADATREGRAGPRSPMRAAGLHTPHLSPPGKRPRRYVPKTHSARAGVEGKRGPQYGGLPSTVDVHKRGLVDHLRHRHVPKTRARAKHGVHEHARANRPCPFFSQGRQVASWRPAWDLRRV